MNVGKIQRISDAHESLDMFLKVCLLPGISLSVDGQGHSRTLGTTETLMVLPCLRKGIRVKLTELETEIKGEAYNYGKR